MPKTKITYLNVERVKADVYAMAKDQTDFGRKYDFTRQVVNYWMHGGMPSVKMLEKFRTITGRSMGYYTNVGRPAGSPPAIRKRAAGKPISQEHKRSLKRVLGIETPEQVQLTDFCENNYKDRLLKVLERIAIALENN